MIDLGKLWNAAVNEARVVEGEIVDAAHFVGGKVTPYLPGSVVSALDQTRTKLVDVGGRMVDYVAGNPPGSLAKGVAAYVSPAAAVFLSPSNLAADISKYQSNIKKLDSWKLTLQSLQGKASAARAENLVKAVDVWARGSSAGGFYQGYNANADALDTAKDLLGYSQKGEAIDPADAKEYQALKPGAIGGFDSANTYAQRIYDAILAAMQKAATADLPTTADYVFAPVSGIPGAAKGVATGVATVTKKAATGAKNAVSGAIGYAEGAAKNVIGVAESVAGAYGNILKWAPYALGAVALGYVILSLPTPRRLTNPHGRKRHK